MPRFDLEFTVSPDFIAVSNGDLLYQVCVQSWSRGLDSREKILNSLFWKNWLLWSNKEALLALMHLVLQFVFLCVNVTWCSFFVLFPDLGRSFSFTFCSCYIVQVLCKEDPSKKTYVYKLNTPVSAQWISLVVGPLEVLPDQNDINVSHICLSPALAKLQNTVACFHDAYRCWSIIFCEKCLVCVGFISIWISFFLLISEICVLFAGVMKTILLHRFP